MLDSYLDADEELVRQNLNRPYLSTTEGNLVPFETIEKCVAQRVIDGEMTIKEAEQAARAYHDIFDVE